MSSQSRDINRGCKSFTRMYENTVYLMRTADRRYALNGVSDENRWSPLCFMLEISIEISSVIFNPS